MVELSEASMGLESGAHHLFEELRGILERKALTPRFQPIFDLRNGSLHGFEGLIRGPSGSVLHAPLNLLSVAKRAGILAEVEQACVRTILTAWAGTPQQHRIFINLSPTALLEARDRAEAGFALVQHLGLLPGNVVIELTESQPTFDYEPLLEAASYLRSIGFTIALDDLGEGFSSLRLWSELHPEFVKVDKHFVQGVSVDPLKLQFLRSIKDLADSTGARVIAEGIETDADLAVVQELRIDYGQGFALGHPVEKPILRVSQELARRLRPALKGPDRSRSPFSRATAERLLIPINPVGPDTTNAEVQARFFRQPALQSIPVVSQGIPLGLLNRHAFSDIMSRPFSQELYGKRPCTQFMERENLVVDQSITIHQLSEQVVASDPRHILHGFILTRSGQYAGMGSGHDLMREITQMQLVAARYANPLTQLPGNVPIYEQLEVRLETKEPFAVCYLDLDHFKPYNDVYGYRRGDELIQWTGSLLQRFFGETGDFIGHIGGDDFILAMHEDSWDPRIRSFLGEFQEGIRGFFDQEDLTRGGYLSEDRQGRVIQYPLVSMSVGAVVVRPGVFQSHHEISAAASAAKKMAKREPGCTLFTERRFSILGSGCRHI